MASGGPETATSVAGLRQQVGAWRRQSKSVGLVPTMGALHDGHSALVKRSMEQCDRTVVSIFVNPKQFAPHEDFATYPRNEAADLARLAELGADLVYMPGGAEMYAGDFATTVSVARLTEGLCSVTRPHFFQGVATVVTKLLLQCLPDYAYFGEKDYQQLQVVRRLARDLDIPTTIVGVPTVREPDGLALSSRNRYLTAAERVQAPTLFRALHAAESALGTGETSAESLRNIMRIELAGASLGTVDYVSVVDADTLRELEVVDRPALASLAVRFPSARLIDCLPLGGPVRAAPSRPT
jgi:pantoate--beta-alanine ligase